MKDKIDYDLWWSNLTISQKERIAKKITKEECVYPKCTLVWKELGDDKKEWIHKHCTSKHGCVIEEFTEGQTMSY